MATSTGKARCTTCGKEKAAYKCEGCSQSFCINHLADHHQLVSKQLDEIEDQRNAFRQILTEQKTNPQKHPLIEQINRWERDSIKKIRETADEAREILSRSTTGLVDQIELKLNKFTEELREIREENDFNEKILEKFKHNLTRLEEELANPPRISVQQDSSTFICKISVVIIGTKAACPDISNDAKWIQNAITVAGGNGKGGGSNQLSGPYGLYVDDDQTIYVADIENHRIVEWKRGATTGQVMIAGNRPGNRNDQLNGPFNVIIDRENDYFIICDCRNRRVVRWPRRNGTSGETIISSIDCRGLAMDEDGYLYVSDVVKNEVRRFQMEDNIGTVVAGGNGKGDRLKQLNDPYCIFVDQDQSVYVSDGGNHRVIKWMEGATEGIVVAGGQGQGNGMGQLSDPRGVIVDQLGTVYVADRGNHRVMRWVRGAREGSVVVGGNGRQGQVNQLSDPYDLSFDRENNLYVADLSNCRVQRFNFDSSNRS